VVQEECPELIEEARAIQSKYSKLFNLFSIYHFKYNGSNPMSEESIVVLGNNYELIYYDI